MAAILAEEDEIIRVTSGYRSYAEQAVLFAQGRTTPGPKVTAALPGHSWHNYGLAVDCAPGVPGSRPWKPNWTQSHPHWKRMVVVGESLGLTSGFRWTKIDYPHFQLTGRYPVSPTPQAIMLLTRFGPERVWKAAQIVSA